MTDKGSVQDRLHETSTRLRGTLMVILLITLVALALMGFLGFVLGSLFFVLGGTVDH
ncbi:hypothetical protein ACF1A5_00840 [Streptomyces sp. NPDC014864]|uniref:hypothetical protein n=1 Tax=Streptomyces sp. NPDC014864 TaxID=3364924 RepID=UPI0036F60116